MFTKSTNETLKKVEDDEPIFVIRSKDILAIEIIYRWIEEAINYDVNEEKIEKARQHLDAVMNWRNQNPNKVKIPD